MTPTACLRRHKGGAYAPCERCPLGPARGAGEWTDRTQRGEDYAAFRIGRGSAKATPGAKRNGRPRVLKAPAGWLRDVRARLGITYREMARKCGVTEGHLANCASGRDPLSMAIAARIARALGVPEPGGTT
jgi:DNA-binding XRE family transcriptional regulator